MKTTTTVAIVSEGGGGNLRERGIMIDRGAGLPYKVCKSPSVQWFIGRVNGGSNYDSLKVLCRVALLY